MISGKGDSALLWIGRGRRRFALAIVDGGAFGRAWSHGAFIALVIALSIGFVGIGSGSKADAKSLKEAVLLSVENHPSVRAARAGQRAATAEIDEARAGFFPSLDVEGATGYERTTSETTRNRSDRATGDSSSLSLYTNEASVTLSQMLFDGFDVWNTTQAARYRARAATLNVSTAREDIALRGVEAYLDVLRNRKLLELANGNVAKHEEFLRQTKFRSKTGVGPDIDVAQAEARVARARNRLRQVQGGLRAAEARYIEAIGEPPDTLFLPRTPVERVPSGLTEALEVARSNSPGLKAVRETLASIRADLGSAEASFWPRVDLEMSGAIDQNADGVEASSNDASAFVRFRYNVFNGGADTARRRRVMEQVSEALERESEVRRVVEQGVRTAFSQLRTAMEQIPLLETNVRSGETVVNGYKRQFELGKRSLQDVLDAENELFVARSGLTNAEFAFSFANYQVLNRMGNLVGTITGGKEGVPGDLTPGPLTEPAPLPAVQVQPGGATGPAGSQATGFIAAGSSIAAARLRAARSDGRFFVQVGAFSSEQGARTLADTVTAKGFPAQIESARRSGRALYLVRVGGFGTRVEAERISVRLKESVRRDAFVVAN